MILKIDHFTGLDSSSDSQHNNIHVVIIDTEPELQPQPEVQSDTENNTFQGYERWNTKED